MTMTEKMLREVERFNIEVLGLPIPAQPERLKSERKEWAYHALEEELNEFADSDSLEGEVDALLDLVYFALGRIVEMGLAPLPLFEQVQEANMAKRRGELSKRPGSMGYDAVKPEGWKPPDLTPFLVSPIMGCRTEVGPDNMALCELSGGTACEVHRTHDDGVTWKTDGERALDKAFDVVHAGRGYQPKGLDPRGEPPHKDSGACAEKKTFPSVFDDDDHPVYGEKNKAERVKTHKDVKGKPPLSRIPKEAEWCEALVFEFGAKKYSWDGFKKTPPTYHEMLSAIKRHAASFADGQDNDPESGLSHIGHIRCNTAMLIWAIANRPDRDDRHAKG